MSGKNMARQLLSVASAGQYGHLKDRTLPFAIFCRDTLHSTWPQGSSMGEFSGVLCSRDTGHANTEWNTNCLPSSSSCTSNSSSSLHACLKRSISRNYLLYDELKLGSLRCCVISQL